jgi:hypothetical protein
MWLPGTTVLVRDIAVLLHSWRHRIPLQRCGLAVLTSRVPIPEVASLAAQVTLNDARKTTKHVRTDFPTLSTA